MKIIILGAGLGGLAVAHHLTKLNIKNLEIHIYEKNEISGGECRGRFLDERKKVKDYIEYCWHAVGSGYLYLFEIFKEIKLSSEESLYDHLVPIHNYWYFKKGAPPYLEEERNFLTRFSFGEGPVSFSYYDYFILFLAQFYIKIIPDSWLEKYQKITWSDFCRYLSPNARRWIVDSTSIYMGMDYRRLDAFTVMKMLRNNVRVEKEGDFFFLDGPYNNLWFDKWVESLKSSGVQFHLGEEVVSIDKTYDNKFGHLYFEDNRIEGIVLGSGEEVMGDIYVNSMDIHNFKSLDGNVNWHALSSYSYQIQEQVSLHFRKKIVIKYYEKQSNYKKPSVMILSDSPWFLMIRVESTVYKYMSGETLAVGIGIWDQPGFNGKTALECDEDELKNEVWEQVRTLCGEHLINEDGTLVTKPESMHGWPTYTYADGFMNTTEPKFSNNINTFNLRPENKDGTYSNLWHSNAYVKTDSVIYCMESAAEAAAKTANSIAREFNLTEPCVVLKKEDPGLIVRALRFTLGFIGIIPPFRWL